MLNKRGRLKMIKKSFRFSGSILLAVLILLAAAAPALAFEARSDTDITIARDEVVNGDLYIAGNSVTIDGTVNGDVFAAGQIVHINGNVNGGVTIAGQAVTLNGNVTNGARIAGQTVSVSGNIGRDLMVASSDLIINKDAVIGKDLSTYSNTTVINGRVEGNVTGGANQLTISSEINGNVSVTVNNLLLTESAKIRGNLNYTSSNTADIKSGSTITGTADRTIPVSKKAGGWAHRGAAGAFFFGIMAFLSIFVIGLLVISIARRQITSLAFSIHDHPVPSLGWGSLCLIVTPLAALVVMVTIIGIPLGLISLVVWGILLFLCQIPVALLIGWMILSRKRDNYSYGFLVGLFTLGLACLYIVGAIPVIGWIIWLGVMIFGLGSLTTTFQSRQKAKLTTPLP